MNAAYLYSAILIAGLVTFRTRSVPFAVFSGRRELPGIITYLGDHLPSCIMMILVIYCIKGIRFSSMAGFMPTLIAMASVIIVHLWKRKDLLSIFVGTAVYMVLVQFVFV